MILSTVHDRMLGCWSEFWRRLDDGIIWVTAVKQVDDGSGGDEELLDECMCFIRKP